MARSHLVVILALIISASASGAGIKEETGVNFFGGRSLSSPSVCATKARSSLPRCLCKRKGIHLTRKLEVTCQDAKGACMRSADNPSFCNQDGITCCLFVGVFARKKGTWTRQPSPSPKLPIRRRTPAPKRKRRPAAPAPVVPVRRTSTAPPRKTGCKTTCLGDLTCDYMVMHFQRTCAQLEEIRAHCDCSGCFCGRPTAGPTCAAEGYRCALPGHPCCDGKGLVCIEMGRGSAPRCVLKRSTTTSTPNPQDRLQQWAQNGLGILKDSIFGNIGDDTPVVVHGRGLRGVHSESES